VLPHKIIQYADKKIDEKNRILPLLSGLRKSIGLKGIVTLSCSPETLNEVIFLMGIFNYNKRIKNMLCDNLLWFYYDEEINSVVITLDHVQMKNSQTHCEFPRIIQLQPAIHIKTSQSWGVTAELRGIDKKLKNVTIEGLFQIMNHHGAK
jgi:hypothetical protein